MATSKRGKKTDHDENETAIPDKNKRTKRVDVNQVDRKNDKTDEDVKNIKAQVLSVTENGDAACPVSTDNPDASASLNINNTSTIKNTDIPIQPFNSSRIATTDAGPNSRTPSDISAAAQAIIERGQVTQRKNKIHIVLINASLETIKTKKGFELVSADTHGRVLQKMNKSSSDYRPDITHQCLLTLLDSPLNKSGLLQIYIQTTQNVLIEVNPHLRVPRTYKRFAGLMVQLLHKLKIRASDGPDVLLKVIKNPITQHLPPGAIKLGTSITGELVDMRTLAAALPDRPVVLVVGAHATGPAEVEWTQRSIAVSQYPLSAAYALARITNAFEYQFGLL